jgi:hypothetical protein
MMGPNAWSYVPVSVTGLTGASAVVSGGADAFALMPGGSVKAWGANNDGRLGTGGGSSSTIVDVNISDVVAVSAGRDHTCALLSSGGVKCWGSNYWCAIGNGSCGSTVPNPTSVVGLPGASVAIAVGDHHSCAVLTDGTVKCWGGPFTMTPTAIAGVSGVASIASGYGHSCALLSSGMVKCWGSNASGELGDGTMTNSETAAVTVVGW